MSAAKPLPPHQREFSCFHCSGKIRIPRDLPPTTAPCPHCGQPITSPGADDAPSTDFVPLFVDTPAETAPAAGTVEKPSAAGTPASTAAPEPAISAGSGIEPVKDSERKLPLPLLIGGAVVLLIFITVIAFAGKMLFTSPVADPVAPVAEESQAPGSTAAPAIIEVWQREVLATLDGFTKARTVKEKLPFVIGGAAMEEKMNAFYSTAPDDSDTPADAWSFIPPPEADSARGIYSMVFDQPPQLDIREFFRPLATLEVQYRLVGADMLLAAFGDSANFAAEPLKIFGVFKREPDGMKLDWETYIQTKHRLFRKFASLPAPGERKVFRLSVAKELIRAENAPASSTFYVFFDPSQPTETLQLNVPTGSELDNTLSEKLTGPEGTKFSPALSATVELEWITGDKPVLRVSRFICWEFLNVGGTAAVPAE